MKIPSKKIRLTHLKLLPQVANRKVLDSANSKLPENEEI